MLKDYDKKQYQVSCVIIITQKYLIKFDRKQ